jgi:hypothetical protein
MNDGARFIQECKEHLTQPGFDHIRALAQLVNKHDDNS